MSKVRSFSEIAPNIAFPEFNFYEFYYSTFEKIELGRIKKLLPLLRYPYDICGAIDGYDGTKGAFGCCLIRKHEVDGELMCVGGKLYPCHEK